VHGHTHSRQRRCDKLPAKVRVLAAEQLRTQDIAGGLRDSLLAQRRLLVWFAVADVEVVGRVWALDVGLVAPGSCWDVRRGDSNSRGERRTLQQCSSKVVRVPETKAYLEKSSTVPRLECRLRAPSGACRSSHTDHAAPSAPTKVSVRIRPCGHAGGEGTAAEAVAVPSEDSRDDSNPVIKCCRIVALPRRVTATARRGGTQSLDPEELWLALQGIFTL
jgi:hypothetical protein